MKKKALLFFIFLFQLESFSQAPSVEWLRTYGCIQFDGVYDVIQTANDGFIAVGYTTSNDGDVTNFHGGNFDGWITKTNASGNLEWQKTLGGSNDEVVYCIQQTTDNGYILAGYTTSIDGDVTGNPTIFNNVEAWIIKIDVSGNILWERTYGSTANDIAQKVLQTADGGYIVTGSKESRLPAFPDYISHDFWVIKINSLGEIEWQGVYGGTSFEKAFDIVEIVGGGYVLCGKTESINGDVIGYNGGSGYDAWIIKINLTGDLVWQKVYGGTNDETAFKILKTSDGGFITSGWTASNNGDVSGNHGAYDVWIVKFDESGNIIWQKTLGGSNSDYGNSIAETIDGNYVIACASSSTDGDKSLNFGGNDVWVLKIDPSGSLIWETSFGGTNSDGAYGIRQSLDGGFIIGGYTYSIIGSVTESNGLNDFLIIKLAPESLSNQNFERSSSLLYPNPAHENIKLKSDILIGCAYNIIDISSRIVSSGILSTESIDISNLSNGMYVISVNGVNSKFVKN